MFNLRSYSNSVVVLLFVCCSLQSTIAGEMRYWYDASCRHRVHATIQGITSDGVVLLFGDGRTKTIALSLLAQSDLLYVAGLRHAISGAIHVSKSSYAPNAEIDRLTSVLQGTGIELNDLRQLAGIDTFINRRAKQRQIDTLNPLWVEIGGIQYEVTRTAGSGHGTGFATIVVRTPAGSIPLDPDLIDPDFRKVTILPSFWSHATFVPRQATRLTPEWVFQRRGPPVALDSVFGSENVWRYELVYNSQVGIWTDKEIDVALQRIVTSEELFNAWPYENQLSDATWNFHRANLIIAQSIGIEWNDSFPWHDGNWSDTETIRIAIKHYDRSIQLVPNWGEALLRRASAFQALSRHSDALSDLKEFRLADNFLPRLPTSGKSAGFLLHSADVIQAQVHSSLGEHYDAFRFARRALNPDDDALLAGANRTKSATIAINVGRLANGDSSYWVDTSSISLEDRLDLSIQTLREATRFAASDKLKETSKALILDNLSTGERHYLKTRDAAFQDGNLLVALLAARIVAKYSIPVPANPQDAVPSSKRFQVDDNEKQCRGLIATGNYAAALRYAWLVSSKVADDLYQDCFQPNASVTFGLGF